MLCWFISCEHSYQCDLLKYHSLLINDTPKGKKTKLGPFTHSYFIIYQDITFIVFNSQVTDGECTYRMISPSDRTKKEKLSASGHHTFEDWGVFWGAHKRKVFIILHLQQFLGFFCFLLFIFSNTWRRNNWMAVV